MFATLAFNNDNNNDNNNNNATSIKPAQHNSQNTHLILIYALYTHAAISKWTFNRMLCTVHGVYIAYAQNIEPLKNEQASRNEIIFFSHNFVSHAVFL